MTKSEYARAARKKQEEQEEFFEDIDGEQKSYEVNKRKKDKKGKRKNKSYEDEDTYND